MKSARERQAERDKAARERIAAEEASRQHPEYIQPQPRGKRFEIERGPDRMPCCGCPKDSSELTTRYADRHRNGAVGVKAGKPCMPAVLAARAYDRSKRPRIRYG